MGKQLPTNPVPITPAVAVFTVDGSLGDVFTAALVANSTLIVKNVPPGKTVKLIASADGARTLTPAVTGAVQVLTLSGAAAAFTCKTATQAFDITGLTSTTAFMAMSWDGLYA